ncbi:MAG: cache domain-containing protein [Gemmatimonadetes bacterium]|nr:cache domain-containing protein [Gemmatimonadota bacterium]
MTRKSVRIIGQAVVLALFLNGSVLSAQASYGTEAQARAMLNHAVVAMKQNKTKALEEFNKGENGFRDHDLYVFCADASTGIMTAHPSLKGQQLRDIKGKKGYPLGKEIMQNAAEGKIKELSYWWPRPGTDKPLRKVTYYTQVEGHNCGVGFYRE